VEAIALSDMQKTSSPENMFDQNISLSTQPESTFEDYSPAELYNILRIPFSKGGIIQLKEDIPETILDQIYLFSLLRYFLQSIDEAGELKLTKAGNIPFNLVKALHALPDAEEILLMPIEEIKLHKDSDTFLVPLLKDFCNNKNITKVQNSKMSLTNYGKKLLIDKMELFKELIIYAFTEPEHQNTIEDALEVVFEFGACYTLTLLDKYGSTPQQPSFYSDKYFTAFPEFLKKISEIETANTELGKFCEAAYQFQLITKNFLRFHLIKTDIHSVNGVTVEKSELFNEIFQITPPAAKSQTETHPVSYDAMWRKSELTSSRIAKMLQEREWNDENEMNQFLKSLMGKPLPYDPSKITPEEKSIELYIQSMEAEPEQAKILIEEALKLDPTNVEALMEQAIQDTNPHKVIKKLQVILKIAREKLGDSFQELQGNFWRAQGTRPYMRVLEKLSDYYLYISNFKAAISIMQEMLVLNSNDNQGIRYQLGVALVATGRYEEYLALRERQSESYNATWNYTYVFYNYKTTGLSLKTRQSLINAVNQNPIVLRLLKNEIPMPDKLPQYYKPGDGAEAIICVNELMPLIKTTPDFSEFLFSLR
jgi:tetratricopeptide (TPR) repeat protein